MGDTMNSMNEFSKEELIETIDFMKEENKHDFCQDRKN